MCGCLHITEWERSVERRRLSLVYFVAQSCGAWWNRSQGGGGGTQASKPQAAHWLWQVGCISLSNHQPIIWALMLLFLGKVSMSQWAFSMENVLGLNLPWRSLSSHLVTTDTNGNINYMSSFQDIHIQKPVKEASETWMEWNTLRMTCKRNSVLKSWAWSQSSNGWASVLGKA